jgi:hypothetical protein
LKYFVASVVATVTFAMPAAPAYAADTSPADYQDMCEQGYQAFKVVLDPILSSPLKVIFGPMERGFCGEQRHVPK